MNHRGLIMPRHAPILIDRQLAASLSFNTMKPFLSHYSNQWLPARKIIYISMRRQADQSAPKHHQRLLIYYTPAIFSRSLFGHSAVAQSRLEWRSLLLASPILSPCSLSAPPQPNNCPCSCRVTFRPVTVAASLWRILFQFPHWLLTHQQ